MNYLCHMVRQLGRLAWQRRKQLDAGLFPALYWALLLEADKTVKSFLIREERAQIYRLLDLKQFNQAQVVLDDVAKFLGADDMLVLYIKGEIRLKVFVQKANQDRFRAKARKKLQA